MIPKSILHCADIEWRDGLPFSRQFNDIYYSRQDGLEESYYTFIEGNNLPYRWQINSTNTNDNKHLRNSSTNTKKRQTNIFRVCEFGFGTGLNFFTTVNTWQQHRQINPTLNNHWLHFYSVEKHPLTLSDFSKSADLWPVFQEISSQLIEVYPIPFKGIYRIDLPNYQVSLFLYWMDLADALNEIMIQQPKNIDAFYLDGFAPAKNPDAWEQDLFQKIQALAGPDATLATFSAAGFVRRGLSDIGFNMSKRKGFGTKREMLTGRFNNSSNLSETPDNFKSKYLLNSLYRPPISRPSKKVAIIGAGIAGCSTARELVEAGLEVHLFESKSGVATGASGSSAGIFYPFLSNDINPTSEFYLQAYYTLLQTIKQHSLNQFVHPIGVTLKNTGAKLKFNVEQWIATQEELSRWVITSANNDIYFPLSGHVDLKAICESLIANKNITAHFNSVVSGLVQTGSQWQIEVSQQKELFDAVVICNSFEISELLPNQFMPANKVRGQTAIVKHLSTPSLSSVWCDSVYAVPITNNTSSDQTLDDYSNSGQTIYGGATFELDDDNSEFSEASHNKLIRELGQLLSTEIDEANCEFGRVGFRYCSIDRLPYVGPVSDHVLDRQIYDDLHHGKQLSNYAAPNYLPNLFVNTAHGARGITSSFLSAQIIKSYILNDSFPLPFKLIEKVHPNRQLFKELKKTPENRVNFFQSQ
ncbi:MAG: bifunctional tRNA (5-methylaminomethyl-2-thiouridine)(34)-methyltransferase MnmD/FAD-dependent 5-carboxymethylaminomethyl-2-thiouridine(34) oxidoreductase MnmC [Gammaproteobacteria bacterium]|nr:bifunctional tRNA (5-methylaminomethyl-2-thiouridine)(34)-methyltransferase MnmD/FAD-dependent 5-carboxymethylaminomethyl-2-thiouridine(34) oxidoreductase MnmC [Gammaproteobacteria bacterium]